MMRSIFIMLPVAAIMALSSCKKDYDCVCTDNHGVATKHLVEATSKQQARKNCDAQSLVGNCELK
jgi:hypothetical protein